MEEIDDRGVVLEGYVYFDYPKNKPPGAIDELDMGIIDKNGYYIYFDNITNDIIEHHELGYNE
jgi:hypothetical protein